MKSRAKSWRGYIPESVMVEREEEIAIQIGVAHFVSTRSRAGRRDGERHVVEPAE